MAAHSIPHSNGRSNRGDISFSIQTLVSLGVFLLLGVCLAGSSIGRWFDERALMENGAQSSALITSVKTNSGDDGVSLRQPIVTFLAADGRTRSFVGKFREEASVGGTITVYYDRNNADHALLHGDELSISALLLGLFSGVAFRVRPHGRALGAGGACRQANLCRR